MANNRGRALAKVPQHREMIQIVTPKISDNKNDKCRRSGVLWLTLVPIFAPQYHQLTAMAAQGNSLLKNFRSAETNIIAPPLPPALASQNKIQQKEKRYYHREESLAEADTKIKNLKKPLKIFCDILKVIKTKVKFSSLRICQKNKQDVQKFAFSPPLLDSIHPLQICLQDIWSIPLPLPPLL